MPIGDADSGAGPAMIVQESIEGRAENKSSDVDKCTAWKVQQRSFLCSTRIRGRCGLENRPWREQGRH